jgi:hypothetical protein
VMAVTAAEGEAVLKEQQRGSVGLSGLPCVGRQQAAVFSSSGRRGCGAPPRAALPPPSQQ